MKLMKPSFFFQIWFKNRRVKWRKELSKTKAEPTTAFVASCSVPNGQHYQDFNHVPYSSSKLMMKDARMLFERSTTHGLDEDQLYVESNSCCSDCLREDSVIG